MKTLLLSLLLLFTNNSFAGEPANCCPEIYKGFNANKLIQIHFTDLIEFSPEDKTITIYFSGEACGSAYEYYQEVVGYRGVKFRLIKQWDYWFLDDDGNVVPCDLATYDIVNGREVLNLTGSGTVG